MNTTVSTFSMSDMYIYIICRKIALKHSLAWISDPLLYRFIREHRSSEITLIEKVIH